MRRTKLTETTFEAIHAMRRSGMSTSDISIVIGVSKTVINRALRFDSLDDFLIWQRERTNEYRSRLRTENQKADDEDISFEKAWELIMEIRNSPDKEKFVEFARELGILLTYFVREIES